MTVIWNNRGTVTPSGGVYPRSQVVDLTATPNPGYRIESWEGTDDDLSFARTNKVTMNGDKTVRVTFSLPQTRTVPGDFTTIQAAIQASRPGDIVSVASGSYRGSTLILDREITLASTNPDDPCVVASTIIDSSGYASPAIIFVPGAGENSVLDGFTITSGTYQVVDSQNATAVGQNGPDGGYIFGGAVIVGIPPTPFTPAQPASPTIKNCVIRDVNIRGGNAGSGGNADATTPAGRGGWGGRANGGGVYVSPFSTPTFINCTITNCSATGGNAGNGGNSSGAVFGGADYQDANHGGSWSNDFTFPVQELSPSSGGQYIGDYRFYSGYGGGVFCDANSKANFIDCNITNNIARGGMSGIGGTRPQGIVIPDPVTAYRIPSYGGGVYCGENADINFVGCNITDNVAPKPDTTYHLDPYLGHGGGVAFEKTTKIRFENCTLSDNTSAVGGGMFWSGGAPKVIDCTFMRNVAYVGGGIYATGSSGEIQGCSLQNNLAGVSPGDVDVIAGQGGGIFGSSIETGILDCVLTNNTSTTSGGGIHIYGPADNDTIIRNCLLTGNQAGRDGGGISANWGAVVLVDNCTIYNNNATGTYGVPGSNRFGGGLYCSYGAMADVTNCIFWNNNGTNGAEIAVGTGFEYEQRCGDVNVSFSDIMGGQTRIYVGDSCPFNWGPGNINVDPLFVDAVGDDFHLQNEAAGQSNDSPCIDAGGNTAASNGMFKSSTSTLGEPDTGIVDLGYHYPVADYCRRWDLYHDNHVDFLDLAVFANSWVGMLGSNSLGYNENDLYDFTTCWLSVLPVDVTPPTPNPMTWEIAPRALTGTSVEMKARTASDSSKPVSYQFEDVNGNPSAWQTDPCYIATGLNPTGQYCFRVRARDVYNNMTAWSSYDSSTGAGCVTDIGDTNAPTPRPFFVISAGTTHLSSRDVNTTSGQFQWDPAAWQWDWWHKVIVDTTGLADDRGGAVEIKFICNTSSAYNSDRKIPITFRPIITPETGGLGIAHGSRAESWRLTYVGNIIVYDVSVNATGGSFGKELVWRICAYDSAQNSSCSDPNQIPED